MSKQFNNMVPLFEDLYPLDGTRLLIIDDDEDLSESIKFFLEDHDSIVSLANNGKIGIDKFLMEKPDIVLVDLNMPGKDGHSVIAEIRNIAPETPILVISGTGSINDAVRSINLGAWDFISKPIMHFEDLELSIRRVLEKSFLINENGNFRSILEKLLDIVYKECGDTPSEAAENISMLAENIGINGIRKSEFLDRIAEEIKFITKRNKITSINME